MIEVLLLALVAFMTIPALVGSLVLWYVLILPKKPPADESNRIGHLRLLWFAVKHPQRFVRLYPWLAKDESEIVDG